MVVRDGHGRIVEIDRVAVRGQTAPPVDAMRMSSKADPR
jgi:hypothetical protein